MKNKLKFLIGVSLKRKIKTKWFFIANAILALAIIGIANIDHLINFFGGDFDSKVQIYVVDETNQSYDVFTSSFDSNIELLGYDKDKYQVQSLEASKEEAIAKLETDEDKDSIMIILKPSEDVLVSEIITNDYIDTIDNSLLVSALNNVKVYLAIEKYNISEEQIAGLTSPVNVERVILDEGKDSVGENMDMIMNAVFPVFILPFFMLVIFLVQMIGAEVNDEKTTRGMEIIISNVSPSTHFFSKCIAGNVFILLQGFLLIVYALLGLFVRTLFDGGQQIGSIITQATSLLSGVFSPEFVSSLSYLIPLILILMVITFVAYSLVAGILASMTTNTEDFQQIQTPIMLICLLGYYLAVMAGVFKGSLFIRILGYCPFISAILSPSLLVIGEFTVIDVLTSIGLTIAVVILLIKYGLRVYKVGILNYSSGGLWKKMFNALKTK